MIPIEDGRDEKEIVDWRWTLKPEMMGNLENEGKRHFVSCRAREKHNFQDYLQSINPWTPPPFFFLSFFSLSFARTCEGVLSFYCARTWHWSFVFSRARTFRVDWQNPKHSRVLTPMFPLSPPPGPFPTAQCIFRNFCL
jgi:hypothetical protein